jgi:hypothetical protein
MKLHLTKSECEVLFDCLGTKTITNEHGHFKEYKTIPTYEGLDLLELLGLLTETELCDDKKQPVFKDVDLELDRRLYQLLALEVFFRLHKQVGEQRLNVMKTLKEVGEKLTPSFERRVEEEEVQVAREG